jgi:hypothetical protein
MNVVRSSLSASLMRTGVLRSAMFSPADLRSHCCMRLPGILRRRSAGAVSNGDAGDVP